MSKKSSDAKKAPADKQDIENIRDWINEARADIHDLDKRLTEILKKLDALLARPKA